MIVRVCDRVRRTNFEARLTENAAAEVEHDRFARWLRDRLGRAHGQASDTTVRTFRGIDAQRAAMTVR